MPRPTYILFLCVANSARSQLAEGLAKKIFGTVANIQSAGSQPSGKVHPQAIETLKQDGIDISKNFSKSIEQLPPEFLNQLDYVITLCAEEVCPILTTRAKKLHWPISDPANMPEHLTPTTFDDTKKIIREKILEFKFKNSF